MATPFLGQISIMAFALPPRGWAQCNGALLPINQNQALFALLGTQYGGNGVVTFALPDLRGRAAVHRSASEQQGQAMGAEHVVLNSMQLPPHTHALRATTDAANQQVAAGALLAARSTRSTSMLGTVNEVSPVAMNGASLSGGGASQGHENMAPFTVLNFVIALQGIFPSRN